MDRHTFKEVVEALKIGLDTLLAKTEDYSEEHNVFSVFEKASEDILATPQSAMEYEIAKKVNRYINLVKSDSINFESLDDTKADALNYLVLLMIYEHRDWIDLMFNHK
jgi:hypothetical protein